MHIGQFSIFDVFTKIPLTGNQLAVVWDADDLDDAIMQTIAREFNFPETVFLRQPVSKSNRANIRIFTPAIELPFAGHPTVGAAVAIALSDGASSQDFVLEELVGEVPCRISLNEDRLGFAEFDVPALAEKQTHMFETSKVAAALGIEKGQIGFDGHHPSLYKAGVQFAFVPLKDKKSVDQCMPDAGKWREGFGVDETHDNAFVYAPISDAEGGDGNHYHARMFWPAAGIQEDPATGSAVAGFAGALHEFENLSDGLHHFTIHQGVKMGRASIIQLTIEVAEGAIVRQIIGGHAVLIAEGNIQI